MKKLSTILYLILATGAVNTGIRLMTDGDIFWWLKRLVDTIL